MIFIMTSNTSKNGTKRSEDKESEEKDSKKERGASEASFFFLKTKELNGFKVFFIQIRSSGNSPVGRIERIIMRSNIVIPRAA